MTTEAPQKQSIFPDMPRESPVVDKDGNFVGLWDLGLSALFQALQANFKNEGIVIPPLTAANMTTIQNLYASYIGGAYNVLTLNLPDISGQTVYDSTTQITNQFVIAQDGGGNVTLAKWVPLAVMLVSAVNPNYNPPTQPGVAGVLNWLCYDIADGFLFICTTAGTQATAVWTQI
jgi:hypothetical protein